MSENLEPKYEIILYWSDEDDLYIAEVPELLGCASHGESLDEAIKNVQIAIRLWIKMAKKVGNPVPAPKGRRLAFA